MIKSLKSAYHHFRHLWLHLGNIQKLSLLTLLIVVISLPLAIISTTQQTTENRSQASEGALVTPPTDQQVNCANSGGTWRQFSNGCADFCGTQTSDGRSAPDIGCTQALTDSCDCGSTQCWNGTSCVLNGSSPQPTPITSSLCEQCGSAGLDPNQYPEYICDTGLTCSYDHLEEDITGAYGACLPPGSSYGETCSNLVSCDTDADCQTGEICLQPPATCPQQDQTCAFMPHCVPATTSCLPADLNQDGTVDTTDRNLLLSKLLTTDASADLNHDGIVDLVDYSLLATSWHQSSTCNQ